MSRSSRAYKPPQTLHEDQGFGWRIETQGMWPVAGGEPIIQLVGEVRTLRKVETIVRAVSMPRAGGWTEDDILAYIEDDRSSLHQLLLSRQRRDGARSLLE